MGTLPRTLVKWEILSGYLWGHYTKVMPIGSHHLSRGGACDFGRITVAPLVARKPPPQL
jgi:hypothetical protein